MGNIIDITSKLKKLQSTEVEPQASFDSIINISELRSEVLKQERRTVKRTILTEFIAVHLVLPDRGLVKVMVHDINENGLSFDLESQFGKFNQGEEVAMRVYLNHMTYFPFVVTVKRQAGLPEEDVIRHGAEFVKGTINDEALHHFVKFIENVSASLKQDRGDVLVTKINS